MSQKTFTRYARLKNGSFLEETETFLQMREDQDISSDPRLKLLPGEPGAWLCVAISNSLIDESKRDPSKPRSEQPLRADVDALITEEQYIAGKAEQKKKADEELEALLKADADAETAKVERIKAAFHAGKLFAGDAQLFEDILGYAPGAAPEPIVSGGEGAVVETVTS